MTDKPELHPVISRVVQTAKDAMDKSSKVLVAESRKIDDADKEYTTADAISTTTQMASIVIGGWAELAKTALEARPPGNVVALGEYMASVVERMVRETGVVASAAADKAETMQYTPNEWLRSMTRLIDIAVAGGLDIVESAVSGPAQFQTQPIESDPITAPASTKERTLGPATIKRKGTDEKVPQDKISYEPPVLVPPNRKFRVRVDAGGLESGVYVGTVTVGDNPNPIEFDIAL
jgi:hypothetical protein